MRRAYWLLPLLLLTSCGSGEPTAEPTEETPRLEAAAEACGLGLLSIKDEGETLSLDGEGDDDTTRRDGMTTSPPGKLTVEQISCTLEELDTPESMTSKMSQTRALDGMQTDEANGLEYTWTYHPDAGLDVIITEVGDA